MKRILSEPLLQFLLLGAVLFAAHAALGGQLFATEQAPFVVDDQLAGWIAGSEARSLGRQPTRVEVASAVNRYARLEALRREARRLGLHEGDPIVDRRLEQKMEFLLEGAPATPTEADLAAWLDAHAADYFIEPIVAFEHQFWSGDWAHERAAAGESSAPFLGGPTARGTVAQLDARFGPGFGAQAFGVRGEEWSALLNSNYGVHRIRVTESVPGRQPVLAEVAERVRRDVTAASAAAGREARIAALVGAMSVQINADLGKAAQDAAP